MKKFVDDVYGTLWGDLKEEYQVEGVENLFSDGNVCDRLYCEVMEAYERLRERLEIADEDEDIEIIINSLLDICWEVGLRMYRCGALFQGKE